MYRLRCREASIQATCRRLSCVYPTICKNLGTDHAPLIRLYRRARGVAGVKKVLIGSGVRFDLAVESPAYIRELVTHHVGGYLKIAPEHTEEGPLVHMMKPGIAAYDRFKALFDRYSREAGKKQYLIPYFIAAHPGTSDQDMLELALWLKHHGFRLDQVQVFLPSPMASATAMYHSGKNPLRKVTRDSEEVVVPKGLRVRRLHKAFLRFHDPENWSLLRRTLRHMGRADLIGRGPDSLVPPGLRANEKNGTGPGVTGRPEGQPLWRSHGRHGPVGRLWTDPSRCFRFAATRTRRPAFTLHNGRLLTLEDTVEFFNLVLEQKLTVREKEDLTVFMRAVGRRVGVRRQPGWTAGRSWRGPCA